LSENLQQRLVQWIEKYGAWIDFESDKLKDNGLNAEEEHNKKGEQLFQEVMLELGGNYHLVFIPSQTAGYYR
jgi:thiamine monophosphate kinase